MGKLDKVITKINKNSGYELIRDNVNYEDIQKIPFPSPKVTWQLYGGLPMKRVTEIAGEAGSGKTTTALGFCGEAQKLFPDKKAFFIDAEHTLDLKWAEQLGVDTDNLYIMRPENETAEEILQGMLDIIDTGEVSVMVLDSVPTLVSKNKFDKEIGTETYAGISQPLTDFLKKAIAKLIRHNTSLFMINQVRDNIGNQWVQYRTPGGRAFEHYSALRLFSRKGSLLDENYNKKSRSYDNPVGHNVKLKIKKTKVCKPDRPNSVYTLNFYSGIDIFEDTIDVATQYDMILQAGPWYRIIDPDTGEILKDDEGEELKFQGKANLKERLNSDEKLYNSIKEKVNKKISEE